MVYQNLRVRRRRSSRSRSKDARTPSALGQAGQADDKELDDGEYEKRRSAQAARARELYEHGTARLKNAVHGAAHWTKSHVVDPLLQQPTFKNEDGVPCDKVYQNRRESEPLVPGIDMLDPTKSAGVSFPYVRQAWDHVRDKVRGSAVGTLIAVKVRTGAYWLRMIGTWLLLLLILFAMLSTVWGGFDSYFVQLSRGIGIPYSTRAELAAANGGMMGSLFGVAGVPDYISLTQRIFMGSDSNPGELESVKLVRRVAAFACIMVAIYHSGAAFGEAADAISKTYRTRCYPFGPWPGDFLQLVPYDMVDACGAFIRHKLHKFFKTFGIHIVAACCIFVLSMFSGGGAANLDIMSVPDKLIYSATKNVTNGVTELLTLIQRSELHDLGSIDALLDDSRDDMPLDYELPSGSFSPAWAISGGLFGAWVYSQLAKQGNEGIRSSNIAGERSKIIY